MKLGDGTLTLTGANTYTGGTTVSGGTLQLGDGTTDGSVAGNITDNATLAFNNASALSYTGVVSGTGAVTMTGDGTLTLSGVNLYTGGTTVAAGTLLLSGGDNRLSTSGAITVSGGVLDLGGYNQTTSGLLSFQGTSPGTLQNGTLTLTAGGTVISVSQSGTIDAEVDMPGSADRNWDVAAGNTLTLDATVNFTSCELSIYGPGTAEFYGAVGGSGGSNWLRGNSGVTITFEDQSSLTVLGIIVGSYSAGTLNWDSSGTLDAGYLLASYGTGGCGTLDQTVGYVGSDTRGSGLYFGSSDSYNLNGGTLRVCEIDAVSGAALTFGGGTLLATGGFQVSADLSCVIPATDTATIDTNVYGLTVVVPGVISGGGGLTVTGTGTLTLSGANTYTGGTVISGGTLQIGDGTTDGSLAGDITDNAALVFDNVAALTFDGAIDGTGSLAKLGAGRLTLTGPDSRTGSTTAGGGGLLYILAEGSENVLEGTQLAFSLNPDDFSNVPTPTFSLETDPTPPSGLLFNATTREVTWTPGTNWGGHSAPIKVLATDPSGYITAEQTISIDVYDKDRPPTISSPPQDLQAAENTAFTYDFSQLASDPDAADALLTPAGVPCTLTYSIEAVDQGMYTGTTAPAIDAATGVFSWTPSELNGGDSYSFTVRVTDEAGLSVAAIAHIGVSEVNVASIIVGPSSITVTDRSASRLRFGIDDPDAVSGQFRLYGANIPSAATITPSGVFCWDPTLQTPTGNYQFERPALRRLSQPHRLRHPEPCR